MESRGRVAVDVLPEEDAPVAEREEHHDVRMQPCPAHNGAGIDRQLPRPGRPRDERAFRRVVVVNREGLGCEERPSPRDPANAVRAVVF